VETLLEGIPKGAERLFKRHKRGLSRTKTGLQAGERGLHRKPAALTAGTNVKISKASTSNLAGFVSFSGAKIPLYKFQVTPKEPGTGKRVKAAVKRGGGTTFEDAFIANMSNKGVFERLTSKRFPVEQLMGLSAAQMVGNEEIISGLEEEAQELVNERLKHEIDRLLNGYGG
jgi:hypothetical protein